MSPQEPSPGRMLYTSILIIIGVSIVVYACYCGLTMIPSR